MSVNIWARSAEQNGRFGTNEAQERDGASTDESVRSEEIVRKAGLRPGNPVMKALLKAPVLLWRLGLGRLAGRNLMIMTTTGRKSGLSRRTPIEFHTNRGRKYIFTLRGPNTDWYRNILTDPRITIQTALGSEHVRARRVTEDREIGEAYDFLSKIPIMRHWASALDVPLSREAVIAHKDSFILVAFDATDEPAPPPLQPDLWWAWPMSEAVALVVWLLVRRSRKHQVLAN